MILVSSFIILLDFISCAVSNASFNLWLNWIIKGAFLSDGKEPGGGGGGLGTIPKLGKGKGSSGLSIDFLEAYVVNFGS